MKKPPLTLGPTLAEGEKPVEVIESQTMYENFVRTERYVLRTRRFDGSWTEPYERHVMSTGATGHAVAVLLYEPERDVVMLVEQFRIINYVNKESSAWNLEIVAGLIDQGETADNTARREVEEETGQMPLALEHISSYTSSPGVFTETLQIYIARISTTDGQTVHGLETEQENIRTHVMSVDDALKLADEGYITDGKTLFALNWFARKHSALRHRWLSQQA